MIITFGDWKLCPGAGELARQYDNLSRSLLVVGDIPDGWTWDMLVGIDGNLDIVTLSPVDGGIGVELTAEMLALTGYYTMQLRGTQGSVVRHTNLINVYVGKSMSGDAKWPEVPSEFSQAENNIRDMNEHPPTPGPNGTWMIWSTSTGQYEESEIPLPSSGGYRIGGGLKLDVETNTLSVDTADEVEEDNTLPITSAAVYTTVGNIEVLLGTI